MRSRSQEGSSLAGWKCGFSELVVSRKQRSSFVKIFLIFIFCHDTEQNYTPGGHKRMSWFEKEDE